MPDRRRLESDAATLSAPPSAGPILSDNVPQEVTYSGQHYIEIKLRPTDFIATARALADKQEARS